MPTSEFQGSRLSITQKRNSPTQGSSPKQSDAISEESRFIQDEIVGNDFSNSTFERHAALLSDAQLSRAANATVRTQIVKQLQNDYGNQYVQRLINHISNETEIGNKHQTISKNNSHIQRDEDEQPGSSVPAPVSGAGDVSVYVGKTMTAEAALRDIYTKSAREISEEALRKVASGMSVEDAAKWAVDARNDLKVQLRAKGSPVTKALTEARNVRKYGNKVGPTFDDLIREGKTPEDIIGTAGKANTKVTRAASKLKILGRFAIALDVAIVTWEVISAPENERLKTAVEGAGGIAGAAGGGWAGAKGGAALGTLIAPGVGTVIGGILGGIGGALAGGFLGRKAAVAAYDIVEDLVTPNLDSQMQAIDTAEDNYIRKRAKSQ